MKNNKAVLILKEMPRYCYECPLHDLSSMDGDWLCLPADARWIENQNEQRENYLVHKPDWCPLKPMPSFKAVDLNDTRDVVMFCHGWNTCLNEITGETE